MSAENGGNHGKFTEIYKRTDNYNRTMLHRLNLGEEDLEDILQTGYIKAFNSMDRLNPEITPDKWFTVVIRNTAYDFLRSRMRHPPPLSYQAVERYDREGVDEDILPALIDPLDVERGALLKEEVQEALQTLTPVERVIFIKQAEGAKTREIGVETGSSEGTVKTRMFRARERLRHERTG